jgi:hypothetical protein
MNTKQFQQYIQTDMFDKFQNPICKGDFVLINSTNPKIGMVLSNQLIKKKVLVGFSDKSQIYHYSKCIIRIDSVTNKLKDLTEFFNNKNAAEKIKLYKFQVQFDYAEFFGNLYYKLTEWLYDNDKYLAERDEYINNNMLLSQITTQTCYKFNNIIYLDKNLTKPIQLYDIIKTPFSAMFYSPKGSKKEYVTFQKQLIKAFYSSMDKMLVAAKEYKREGKNKWI